MSSIHFRLASSAAEILMARQIRNDVFVKEQGIPREREMDDDDDNSIHLLATCEDQVIGTGRLTIHDDTAILSRIAVVKECRSIGTGKQIIMELEKIAAQKKCKTLSLYPHAHLEEFYKSLGYNKEKGGRDLPGFDVIFMTKTF